MTNEYNEYEKTWHGPPQKLNVANIGIGQVILEKLKIMDPQRVLEVEHESGVSLTAGLIRHQTITVAQNLIRLGVKKRDIVIVFSKSNSKITPITFALFIIGAPVNFFTLDFSDDIEYFFKELNPTVILYEEEFKNDILEVLKKIKLVNLKHVLSLDSESESLDKTLFRPTTDINSFQLPDLGNDLNDLPALLVFTSGSTGRPKIAMHSHSMMLLGVYNKWWHMDANSVVCTLSDLRWISQLELMLQPVFYDVIRIYTSKREKECDDAYKYELLTKNKVTHFCTVPTSLLCILKNIIHFRNGTSKLSHLVTILLGGEAVSESLIEYAARILPNCKIVTCYGMTELHGIISSDEGVTGKIVNGGILSNEYVLKVIDEDGNSLGPNEKGRLCLKSKVRIMGYFGNDLANKAHLKDGEWFETDDYGFMDYNNLLNVVIRFRHLLRYNGQFVSPTELESIVNNHPNVLMSALVGYPDPDCADSDIGTIFVVLRDDVIFENIEDELLVFVRQNLTSEQAKFIRFLKIMDMASMCNFVKANRTALKAIALKDSGSYLRL